ncbi:hypothetical protein I2I11_15510 [Pontibacter sp. 172403-2]|nr:hypothetical protein [Pontibacter sp. 172403-2]
MSAASAVATQAALAVEAFLRQHPATLKVVNVEENPAYQARDIDLLWQFSHKGTIKEVSIEIKGDRWHKTGNYFFETISNEDKGTPGCFLYTEANYIYYYFVEEKELHVLPMPATRNWFLQHLHEFKERKTSTPVANGNSYITVGRLVPRKRVQAEVPHVRVLQL